MIMERLSRPQKKYSLRKFRFLITFSDRTRRLVELFDRLMERKEIFDFRNVIVIVVVGFHVYGCIPACRRLQLSVARPLRGLRGGLSVFSAVGSSLFSFQFAI